MKIVIAHKNTKREIEGVFNICASREDFIHLKDEIERWLGHHPTKSYGWMEIVGERQPPLANQHPIKWED